MLPTASTFTRADEVGVFGTVIVAAPLFGIAEASVNGKLLPPSTESSTRTLVQLMGALDVFATFQLTVCVEPAGQLVSTPGCVIANGPALETTLTRIAPVFTPPPPA